MAEQTLKVSDSTLRSARTEMMKRLKQDTAENMYQDAMLNILEENLKDRPIGGSEFGPDGAQTLRVCGGL